MFRFSDTTIVGHRLVGDIYHFLVAAVLGVVGRVHHEAERFEEFLIALELHQIAKSGAHKDVVEQIGSEIHLCHTRLNETHRGVCIQSDVVFFKLLLLHL